MKNAFRMVAVLLSLVMCVGAFSACGGQVESDNNTKAPTTGSVPGTETTGGTEPFVAPPDALGCVLSADSQLITWYAYESDKETIDFMGVDVKTLGEPASDMSLFYLEAEVSYYLIKDGKLVDATIDDVIPESVVGITTLEEGVQEVYIIYQPAVDDGSDEVEDVQEEIVDEFPTESSAATEEDTPDQEEDTSGEVEE